MIIVDRKVFTDQTASVPTSFDAHCSSTIDNTCVFYMNGLIMYINIIEVVIYIFPKSKFFVISRPVIRTVLYNVGRSSVDVKVSARPNGIISGIQPASTKISVQ